jgi:hypothetical protein
VRCWKAARCGCATDCSTADPREGHQARTASCSWSAIASGWLAINTNQLVAVRISNGARPIILPNYNSFITYKLITIRFYRTNRTRSAGRAGQSRASAVTPLSTGDYGSIEGGSSASPRGEGSRSTPPIAAKRRRIVSAKFGCSIGSPMPPSASPPTTTHTRDFLPVVAVPSTSSMMIAWPITPCRP